MSVGKLTLMLWDSLRDRELVETDNRFTVSLAYRFTDSPIHRLAVGGSWAEI